MDQTDYIRIRPAALHTRNLEVTYEVGGSPIKALQRNSLTIEQGTFVVLLGASGAGKSTLLRTLNGLVRPTSGNVIAEGTHNCRNVADGVNRSSRLNIDASNSNYTRGQAGIQTVAYQTRNHHPTFARISHSYAVCRRLPTHHQYSKSQLLSVGIFFARSPSENRNDVASIAPLAARFPARFPQIPLFVISRYASARDATSSIFNDLPPVSD